MLGFSLASFVFRDGVPFFWVYGIYFIDEGFMTGFREEGSGEEVRMTFLLLSFSQTPLASNIQYAKLPYIGVVCPEPYDIHQLAVE